MAIRVLIADDHAVFRSGLRAFLQQEAPELEVVAEAGTGEEALREAARCVPDLAILDISMPGLRGPEVAARLLAERPELPIVVLTMHEDEYYLRELLKVGVRAFVLKKSTGTAILEAVRTALSGERYVDPSLAGRLLAPVATRRRPGRAEDRGLEVLTPREREVCTLLAFGNTNAEIAEKLSISRRTVETHRTNLLKKLQLKGRVALVRFAIDHGLMRVRG